MAQSTVVVSFPWFIILGDVLNPVVCCLDDQFIRHICKFTKSDSCIMSVCMHGKTLLPLETFS